MALTLLFSNWTTSLFMLLFLVFAVYFLSLLRRPSLHQGTPKLSPGWPIVGSMRFYQSRQQFMKSEMRKTATGHFSFFFGPYNIIALSGHSARETFYASRPLDLISAFSRLYAAAPNIDFLFEGDLADSFLQTFKKFLQKDHITTNLYNFVSDTQEAVANIKPNTPIDPFEHIFSLIYKLSHRSLGCNEIADDPKLLANTMEIVRGVDWTSGFQIMFTGFPTYPKFKKQIAGLRLYWVLSKIINERRRTGVRYTDATQALMDQGFSNIMIVSFVIAGVFAAVTNTGNQAAWVMCHLAQNRDWYNRVRNEVDDAISRQREISGDYGASSLDVMRQFPLETWDTGFPSIDLALRESIRLDMTGASFRRNISDQNVLIAGTKEIIPPGTYVVYDMDDIHRDESIYTNPGRWDPSRYLAGREEHQKVPHAYLGWGTGLHPCPGQRFAQLEVTIATAMLISQHDFWLCDKNGGDWTKPLPSTDRNNALGTKSPKEHVYLTYTPRAQSSPKREEV